MPTLAIDGGTPVRSGRLPYGRQSISEDDIAAVTAALRSEWLTTGPRVEAFEEAFARATASRHAVAVSNGTAALHAAVNAMGVLAGDEVIVPAITFAATANSVVFEGGTPVFADVDADTLLIDPEQVERLLRPRTRAVIAVDYAGQPCDYDRIRALTEPAGIGLIADACHALGGTDRGRAVGTLADLSTFSLHAVKHVTSGEGGVVTTDDANVAARMRSFRNHGITTDHRQREHAGSWEYDMVTLGFNYRLTDVQCALAQSQLQKLPAWVVRRQEIARRFSEAFADSDVIRPISVRTGVSHAYHLYVVRLNLQRLSVDRGRVFAALRAEGVGVNVHYRPVHLHPFYRQRFGTGPGLTPNAERAYHELLTLPLFPAMSDADVEDVIIACVKVTEAYRR